MTVCGSGWVMRFLLMQANSSTTTRSPGVSLEGRCGVKELALKEVRMETMLVKQACPADMASEGFAT